MLKFKVDENMPVEAAAILADAGYDARTVLDQRMVGWPDPDVATACQQEGRAVITLDMDFSDIRAYPPADYSGLIVLRLSRLNKPQVLRAIERLLPVLDQEPLTGKLWIVDETSVRIRN